MGLSDWFRRRTKQHRPDEPNSIVIDAPSKGPHVGFTERSTLGLIKQREAAYESIFGEPETVSHEINPLVPHIDVYVYRPGSKGRTFYTLITGGMSDLRMVTPASVDAQRWARAELVLYASEPKEVYIELLRHYARYPHDHQTGFAPTHTVTNGHPPEPLFEGSQLDNLLFLTPIVHPDAKLSQRLVLEGDAVNPLWVVPITTSERESILTRGVAHLLRVFEKVKHPVVLDPFRRSYV